MLGHLTKLAGLVGLVGREVTLLPAAAPHHLVPAQQLWVQGRWSEMLTRGDLLRRKLMSCSQCQSWVKGLTLPLIGSLFSDSQSGAKSAL